MNIKKNTMKHEHEYICKTVIDFEDAKAIKRMTAHYNKLLSEDRISKDRQPPLNMPNDHTDILVEQLFYSYMELLEKEYKK